MASSENTWGKEVLTAYEHAKSARSRAYAKYSNFYVGSCLALKNGQYIVGANVENVSNGATICAEQVAITQTIAQFGKAEADFIIVVSQSEPPASPCGICLQVLNEFFKPDFPIYLAGLDKIVGRYTLKDFLPMAYTSDQLLSSISKKS